MPWVIERPSLYVELKTEASSPHICWIPIATRSNHYTLIAYAGISEPVPDLNSANFNSTISEIVRKEYLQSAEGLLVSAIPTEFEKFHPSLLIAQPNPFRKLAIQIDDTSKGQFVLEYPSQGSPKTYVDVHSLDETRLDAILGLILENGPVKVRWSKISVNSLDLSLRLKKSPQPLWG